MPAADVEPDAVETTVRFGQLLGAVPYFVDPLEYDQMSLGVETLPGASAAAMLRSISRTAGWRDILRYADLPFAVATLPIDFHPEDLAYLLLHDRDASGRWLQGLIDELGALQRLVRDGEAEILNAYLQELDATRDKWLQERSANDWNETKTEAVELPTFREQFLGSLASRRGDRD
jgi:prephenate dehydrogenase